MSKLTIHIGATITELAAKLRVGLAEVKSFAGKAKAFLSNVFSLPNMIIGGAFGTLVKSVVNFADEIGDQADKLNISAEAWQIYNQMAKYAGASMDDIGTAMKRVSVLATDAANGSAEAAEAFGRVGLTLQDLQGLTPDQMFEKVAKAVAAIKNPVEQTAAAVALFGKSGTELIGLAKNFDDLKSQAEATASIIDGETIAAAGKLNDTLSALWTNIASGIASSGLIEWLSKAAESFNSLAMMKDRLEKNGGFASSEAYKGGILANIKDALLGEGEGSMISVGYTDEEAKKLEDAKKAKAAGTRLTPTQQLEATNAKREQVKAEIEGKGLTAYVQGLKDATENENLLADGKQRELAIEKALDAYRAKVGGRELKANETQDITAAAGSAFDAKVDKQLEAQIKSLLEQARIQKMINEGKEREAFIQQKINEAEKASGKLSDMDKSAIETAAGTLFDMQHQTKKEAGSKGQDAQPARFTSLEGYGGGYAGLKAASSGANSTVDQVKKSNALLTDMRQSLATIASKIETKSNSSTVNYAR